MAPAPRRDRREAGKLVVLHLELQRQYGEFVEWIQEERRRRDPRLRSHVIRYNADQPRVPAGEHGGGQWTSGGDGSAIDTGSAPGAAAPPSSQRGPQYAQADSGTRTDAPDGSGGNVSAAAVQQYEQNVVRDFNNWIDTHNRHYDIISSSQIPDDSPKHAVPLADSSGQSVLDDQGNPILRPADLPPESYVQAGLIAKSHNLADDIHNVLQAVRGDPSGPLDADHLMAAIMGTVQELLPFTHGGVFDAERFNSNYVSDYRHYTSIALGIFMAAAGVSREDMLAIADAYASRSSSFSAHEEMDPQYTHSAKQDIEDNLRGYELYESGRIRLNN